MMASSATCRHMHAAIQTHLLDREGYSSTVCMRRLQYLQYREAVSTHKLEAPRHHLCWRSKLSICTDQ